MPRIFAYNVEPKLPKRLAPLLEIAYNLWWAWHHDAIALFRRIDRDLWETVYHNPVRMLGRIDQARLEELATDEGFCSHLTRVSNSLHNYLTQRSWYEENYNYQNVRIAYFSMEYGLTESIPIYSGGLGVLSGDTIKSSSDLGLPMVATGLAFQQGYFRQYLNVDGWQQESYPTNDFFNLPMRPVMDTDDQPLKIPIWFPHRTVMVQIWKLQVGRVPLFLLDTNVPDNDPQDRRITESLYGGDQEMRIQQETVLGLGGIRALHAMNIVPSVCHMNEGHSAFSTLDRIRLLRESSNLSYHEAREAVGSSNVFTTHTPVPAGFDIFSPALIEKYMRDYPDRLGLTKKAFYGLGRQNPNNLEEGFNMALVAGRHASYINGVSKLHAEVTKEMVKSQWPEIPKEEVPIHALTNGIHLRSWISKDMAELLDTYLGERWHDYQDDPNFWDKITAIPDEELWRTHLRRRERLVNFSRRHLNDKLRRRGAPKSEVDEAIEMLNPNTLTIGFARRFATYKRASLILRNPDRIRRLLTDPERPIQIIFAGKAHPNDMHGKELIRQIVHFARNPEIRRHFVFLEDYDINVARYLVQGVDVWLNTPRRPMEASGTSGMKVAINGGLNLSVLDGWWAEGYNPDVGWAIGMGENYSDIATQDHVEASALYNLLEREIVPQFYNRDREHLPREWIGMMKQSMRQLCPFFNTHRMTKQYAEHFYLPASIRCSALAENDYQRARELASWKQNIAKKWHEVKIVNVKYEQREAYEVGEPLLIEAEVDLGNIKPEDVAVEVFAGHLNPQDKIDIGKALSMENGRKLENGLHHYHRKLICETSGRQGFGVRVTPSHPDMITNFDLSLVTWA